MNTMNNDKFVILGDTHFGNGNSSLIHHANMRKFYVDLFKYIDDNGITSILQLGDLFDVRKHINTWTLNYFREVFLNPVIQRNLHVYVLLGNHDIYYRESLSVSSVEEVLGHFSNWFTVIKEPKEYTIGGSNFLVVPWVCKENEVAVSKAIAESTADYCAGHFEFNGFEFFQGQFAKAGHNHTEYSKFKTVFSGHYHHRSSRDNIVYTGTPYQLTWNDNGCSRGFYVFQNGHYEFVENIHQLYSAFSLSQYPDGIPEEIITEKYVKITVDTELDSKSRTTLLDRLYSYNPHTIRLIEPRVESAESVSVQHTEKTGIDCLITDYVNNMTTSPNIDRDRLNTIMLNMFIEASANAS